LVRFLSFFKNIREGIAQGKIIIPKNRNRNLKKLSGIGKGLQTKVNANIGSSSDLADVNVEIKKASVAEEAGADAIIGKGNYLFYTT